LISYHSESLYQLMPDIFQLLEMHHAESHQQTYGTELATDWDQYRQMESCGLLRIFTVRDDGDLVGYDIFIVGPHRHAMGSCVAISDAVYVKPEYRGFTAVLLMKKSDKALIDSGVNCIVRNSQTNTKVQSLLQKMGYTPSELMMIRKV